MNKLFTSIVLCVLVTSSQAQEIPVDEAAFAKIAAERVQQELQTYDIKPTSRLTVEGKRADGESTGQLSLDRIYSFCSRNSANCSAALIQYAKGISETIKERDRPIDKGMVRLAIRPMIYVENIKKQMSTGTAPIYGKPLAREFAVVPVLDYTRSVRFANEKDLTRLGVTEDEAFKLGEQNLRSTVKPLAEVTPILGKNSFGSITGEDYATSRVVFHQEWKDLADKLNGNLIVMLPAPDILLYGDGSTPKGVEAMRIAGREIAQKTTRPLSQVVLRWTQAGWEEMK